MSQKPRGLGKGLQALLGEAASAVATTPGTGLRNLSVSAMEPGPFQPREAMDEAALEELAASMREHGVLQPILVRPAKGDPSRFQIIGGERRWRAAQRAGLHEVPALVRDFSDREAMAAGLVENLQRQDLNALEEAEGYGRLTQQFGLTQDALAKIVGKSRPHVANTLRLLNLPERVRDLLRDGALTAGHARALLTARDPEALALAVVDRGLNVRQAEALAASREVPPRAPRAEPDAETRRLERDISMRIGLKVSIRHGGKGGQVVLSYRDLDQLDGIVRLLTP
ncbi:ParB/RepB/Spo0J family partition protein [Sabulicella glaciei]|uniref:ParB/RepB/Spo0J family partition protein n=1 Tax=Sabulicella glaciei TaxID=2984948 RepID=A0ABT3P143_9PROT|nr:ParB/RepB/Spo0J family partition protein [Roseococcus sp. MDT2-1-1]MCW8088143.1 ParB/RepB/Spo0J family partition protein [Roseococcus sp. MDT2-1-1]